MGPRGVLEFMGFCLCCFFSWFPIDTHIKNLYEKNIFVHALGHCLWARQLDDKCFQHIYWAVYELWLASIWWEHMQRLCVGLRRWEGSGVWGFYPLATPFALCPSHPPPTPTPHPPSVHTQARTRARTHAHIYAYSCTVYKTPVGPHWVTLAKLASCRWCNSLAVPGRARYNGWCHSHWRKKKIEKSMQMGHPYVRRKCCCQVTKKDFTPLNMQ